MNNAPINPDCRAGGGSLYDESVTDDELSDMAAPNCPVDLVPMVAEGDGERARWRCPECGLVKLN